MRRLRTEVTIRANARVKRIACRRNVAAQIGRFLFIERRGAQVLGQRTRFYRIAL